MVVGLLSWKRGILPLLIQTAFSLILPCLLYTSIPVEHFPGLILFNDNYRNRLDHLIGGEALAAAQAFPSSADSFPVVGGRCV